MNIGLNVGLNVGLTKNKDVVCNIDLKEGKSKPVSRFRNLAQRKTVELCMSKRLMQHRHEREQSEPADTCENQRREGL